MFCSSVLAMASEISEALRSVLPRRRRSPERTRGRVWCSSGRQCAFAARPRGRCRRRAPQATEHGLPCLRAPGPPFPHPPVLNAAMEYSHRTMALEVSAWDREPASLGPYTAASTCRGG